MHSAIDTFAISNHLSVCQYSTLLFEILVQPVIPNVPLIVSAILNLTPSQMLGLIDIQSHQAALAPPTIELLGYLIHYAGITCGLGFIQGSQVASFSSKLRDILI